MRRFFLPSDNIRDGVALITGTDAHHITGVLRMKDGDRVILVDGAGTEYTGEISGFEEGTVRVLLLEGQQSPAEPELKVTVWQGIPKGDRMETVIQKCTELGAVAFRPLLTERTVVKLPPEKRGRKTERWQKIAAEAAKQSRRGSVPVVHEITEIKDIDAAGLGGADNIVFWESETEQGLREYLRAGGRKKKLNIFIGPEGGFSAAEVERILAAGAVSLSLGRRILRTETAGMTALALCLYENGDMDI